jgi:hypothetical protein
MTIAVLLLIAMFSSGCMLQKPTPFPVAPKLVETTRDGLVLRGYDTDDDGVDDYGEYLSAEGRVVELGFIPIDCVGYAKSVSREPGAIDRCRKVFIVLDSIPFHLVKEAYDGGRFRNFYPPSRVIVPFPVMTDTCLNELFGTSPATAVETEYFDGERLRDGWFGYAESDNSRWLSKVDVSLPFSQHGHVYMNAANWFDHELALLEEAVAEGDCGETIGYSVSTSALGVGLGRDGHVAGLVTLDRFCQALMHRFRGDIEITMVSDHGHNLQESRRLDLRGAAEALGYRVRPTLERVGDVVIPEFGLVSYAGVYTKTPARFARDLAAIEGVELVAFRRADGGVGVVDRTGEAIVTITQSGDSSVPHPSASLKDVAPGRELAFRYEILRGDPLRLAGVIARLQAAGRVDANGFAVDAVLREALADAYYPDALYRLHRAFNGLVEHTSQVLVSLEDGWFSGSPLMSQFLSAKAIHGGLNRNNSYAFVMSTAAQLPATMRMDELMAQFRRLGVVQSDDDASRDLTRGPGNGLPVR